MRRGFPIKWKSHARRLWRKKLKQKERTRRRRAGKVKTRAWKSGRILAFLRQTMRGKMSGHWDRDGKTYVIPMPERFSLITNPDESLDVVYTLVMATKYRKARRIMFDHSRCEEMDLGASAILDVVALQVRDEWKKNKIRGRFAGRFPESEKIRQMFICTGLYRTLGLHAPAAMLKQFEIYPLFSGHKGTGDQSYGGSDQVNAAESLAEHVSKCLATAGYTLSMEGQQLIAQWAGEIIDNAEDHSGEDAWHVIAHMDKSVEGVEGECHLAIFGFGKSIYESINDSTTPEVTRNAFRTLAAKHRGKGFFGLANQRYNEPDLWTMYALQERVSRFNGRDGFTDRGTGTVSMIEAFQGFGGTHLEDKQPFMNLVSGGSRILFDGRYKLELKTTESGEIHHVIAFNPEKDLEEKPDDSCVHSLRCFFPGTVINFKFFIDHIFLEVTPP